MKIKKIGLLFLGLFISLNSIAQDSSAQAKTFLDEVSEKMGAYKNMYIGFTANLINKDVGVNDATRGNITLEGEKYRLKYLGNDFVFNGDKLIVINHEEKEITINDGDMEEDDGFIYPSKLLTFYKEGYNYKMGELKNSNGRKLQYVTLTPIDSASDIIKVELAIDARTKHIYKLIQTGANGSTTSFTINKFKSNQALSEKLFSFDKAKYEKQGYLID